jgi:hypothetical protein
MSHHYSGPDFGFPHGDARVDLSDLFAFPHPGDAGKTTLIMNAHPSVGVNPPGPTTTQAFNPEAIYELKIDTNGDQVADVAYRVRFTTGPDGGQTATVRRAEGPDAAGMGETGALVVEGAPVSEGEDAQVTTAGAVRFFAGWRSDPFFFDVGGALNEFKFTGEDFFADKDICSIALEVPNSDLGAGPVALWHRTLVRDGGGWAQADRGARGSQSVFFCPGEEKAAYLGGEPAGDARFVDSFAHVLEHSGGYAPEEAQRVAHIMLPDVLRYDPARPVVYPDNGRLPTDDVSDYFLGLFTNGQVTGDKVGPHGDLIAEFPYLGPPHAS